MDTRKLLLKATDIENMTGERKVHFLNPNAVRINKSLGDAVGLNQLGMHLIYVEPGRDTTEYHKHHFEEECVYVLSGRGPLTIEGDAYSLRQATLSVCRETPPLTASPMMVKRCSSAW